MNRRPFGVGTRKVNHSMPLSMYREVREMMEVLGCRFADVMRTVWLQGRQADLEVFRRARERKAELQRRGKP